MRDDQPHIHRQKMQETVFLPRQIDRLLIESNRLCGKVDRQRSDIDDVALGRCLEGSAQRGVAAGQQFGHAERLDDVIVRAGLEQPDLFLLTGDD